LEQPSALFPELVNYTYEFTGWTHNGSSVIEVLVDGNIMVEGHINKTGYNLVSDPVRLVGSWHSVSDDTFSVVDSGNGYSELVRTGSGADMNTNSLIMVGPFPYSYVTDDVYVFSYYIRNTLEDTVLNVLATLSTAGRTWTDLGMWIDGVFHADASSFSFPVGDTAEHYIEHITRVRDVPIVNNGGCLQITRSQRPAMSRFKLENVTDRSETRRRATTFS
jgi:hypothetical protein